jgi:DNA invertase Pin-like site-specific DNA recombinase
MPIALVYARFSKDKNDQKISVDRQVKLCTARAADLWPDAEIKVFRDDSVSGSDPDAYREGFEGFLVEVRGARKGEIVGVVVNEQSRLTRQGTHAWDDLVVTLTMAGITKVETLRQGPISVEPGNRLVGRLLAVVDNEESERTKARTQDAHLDLFNEGRPATRAPYGYSSTKVCPGKPLCPDADDGKRPHLAIDPDEGPVVQRIYAMALDGHSISAIVRALNADTVPPPGARLRYKDGRKITEWKQDAVRSVLKNPSVAGLRGHRDAAGELHTVPARWPHLIDPDQWHKVQRLLGQPATIIRADGKAYRVRTMPKAQPRKYLLSGGRRRPGQGGVAGESYGVLRCGKCDSPLAAQTQGRAGGVRVPGYACHKNSGPDACCGVSITPAAEVEKLVVDAMQKRLTASSKARKLLHASDDAEVARWRAERDRAKARMLEASEMYGTGAIDRDEFEVMRTPAKAAHDAAEARLASISTDSTLPSVEDVQEHWETLTLKQQRAVVERLIESIVIAPSTGGLGFDRARIGVPNWRV